jgi:hypothetical protein
MTKENIAQIVKRIELLENAVFVKVRADKQEKNIIYPRTKINFSLNERAFVKRYAADKSGPKEFTLMVAYLAKGKVGENISLSDIKKHWNKMKSLLGEFNMSYTNKAKTDGWVDAGGRGIYKLTEEWEQVLWKKKPN